MHIRTASLADAAALAAVEAACFPPAEAATAAEITDRLAYYADHFWLLEEDDVGWVYIKYACNYNN